MGRLGEVNRILKGKTIGFFMAGLLLLLSGCQTSEDVNREQKNTGDLPWTMCFTPRQKETSIIISIYRTAMTERSLAPYFYPARI